MSTLKLSWKHVHRLIRSRFTPVVDTFVNEQQQGLRIYGVPRGGAILAGLIYMNDPILVTIVSNPITAHVIIDDIIDSGETRDKYKEQYGKPFWALFDKTERPMTRWVVFPWEFEEPVNDYQKKYHALMAEHKKCGKT